MNMNFINAHTRTLTCVTGMCSLANRDAIERNRNDKQTKKLYRADLEQSRPRQNCYVYSILFILIFIFLYTSIYLNIYIVVPHGLTGFFGSILLLKHECILLLSFIIIHHTQNHAHNMYIRIYKNKMHTCAPHRRLAIMISVIFFLVSLFLYFPLITIEQFMEHMNMNMYMSMYFS